MHFVAERDLLNSCEQCTGNRPVNLSENSTTVPLMVGYSFSDNQMINLVEGDLLSSCEQCTGNRPVTEN